MLLTHHGHACVELRADSGDSILIDPGSLADDLSHVPTPGAVLITHKHEDHLDLKRLEGIVAAAPVPVFAPADAEDDLRAAGFTDVRVLADGPVEPIAGFRVSAGARAHETIYPGLPLPENIALTIDDRLYHPGDSLQPPGRAVDVLLLPLGAPWLKLAEIIDFAKTVAPRLVIPIHQGGLAEAHRRLHCGLLTRMLPEGSHLVTPDPGVAFTV